MPGAAHCCCTYVVCAFTAAHQTRPHGGTPGTSSLSTAVWDGGGKQKRAIRNRKDADLACAQLHSRWPRVAANSVTPHSTQRRRRRRTRGAREESTHTQSVGERAQETDPPPISARRHLLPLLHPPHSPPRARNVGPIVTLRRHPRENPAVLTSSPAYSAPAARTPRARQGGHHANRCSLSNRPRGPLCACRSANRLAGPKHHTLSAALHAPPSARTHSRGASSFPSESRCTHGDGPEAQPRLQIGTGSSALRDLDPRHQ